MAITANESYSFLLQAVVAAPQLRIADLPVFKVVGFEADQPAVILGRDVFAGRRFVIDHLGGRVLIADPVAAGMGDAK
ncbi:hypothetical protein [Brevundimonas sp. UBA5936]|uniref:hypothetical protein n=1 Tax=Brevundimonas sp. UBA5936 TaxID=1946133 RepID=UPI0025BC6687|nr:hypothetical protein [Brevundimonas sp. UBA5936]